MKNVLIIDDEIKLRGLLGNIIRLEGYDVSEAGTIAEGMKKLATRAIDVVLCDVKLPDGNGIETTQTIKERYPDTEVIVMTAFGNIHDGVQAMKNGAYDYLVKGDDNDKIIPLLNRAMERVELRHKVHLLERQVSRHFSFDQIIGQSEPIQHALKLARKVAQTDIPVLLTGETGTGKEIFAQSIHHASARSHKPYTAINCAAISKDLLESELFGHTRGAFTGAVRDKKGILEAVNGGTVFLDEIGEMSPELQPKLLRFLENGEFIRIGDSRTQRVNVRIISATNRNLLHSIADGIFREDLYYRLAAFQIALPSLRERPSDIELLARNFLTYYALRINKSVRQVLPAYFNVLEHYQWPGNIRELKNVVERSLILADSDVLGPESLPQELTQQAPDLLPDSSAFSMDQAEKLHIIKVLNHTGGNKTEAARLLGIGLTTLYRKIESYKL